MTAGIPGAGIGGVFYLLTALGAPLWMLVCLLTGRRRAQGDWRRAFRHCLLAVAILAAIWLTAWGLGLALASRTGVAAFPGAPVRGDSGRWLGMAMVYLTLGTLGAVLIGVELLRLATRRRRAALTLAIGVLLSPAAMAQQAASRADGALTAALARADEAFADGDTATAEREYRAVLALDPDHSRALFKVGHLLGARDPKAAAGYLRHYTLVEPDDAWGHLALAGMLARLGRSGQAQRAFAAAFALAPTEPDVLLGRPRLLVTLGAIDRAIEAYRVWLGSHPGDADAWRELADACQRARRWAAAVDALQHAIAIEPDNDALTKRLASARLRLAPAITGLLMAVGETDITTFGPGASADVAVGGSGRLGANYRRRHVSSLGQNADSQRLGASFTARPRADVQVEIAGGGAWLRPGGATTSSTHGEASGRVRRMPLDGGVAVDVRGHHGPLDLTPDLIADPVVASQVTGTLEVPLTRLVRLRGLGRASRLSRREERNTRTGIGGGAVARVADGVRLGGQWQRVRNSLPTATGYFAPERAELADAGLELEREFDRVSLAVDAGAGVQRVRKAGEPMGGWARALRVWSYAAWNVAPGRQVLFELEAYDSQVATIVQTSERWRHASFTVSFRIALGS